MDRNKLIQMLQNNEDAAYCTHPTGYSTFVLKNQILDEFDKLEARVKELEEENERLKGAVQTLSSDATKFWSDRDKLRSALDKICEPIESLHKKWGIKSLNLAEVKEEEFAVNKSSRRIFDYLDQKQEKPQTVSEYRNDSEAHASSAGNHEVYNGAWGDCPICNPKPCCSNCKETKDPCACMRNPCIKCGKPVGNITFTVCDECWDTNKSPQPCPDCAWGQCKVEYGRGINKQNIVVYEPCPTCKGKRVIEERK
jgi:regulator of replication initiation timing